MRNIKTLAVTSLSVQIDRTDTEIKNKLINILGEKLGTETYETCQVYYKLFDSDNLLLETGKIDSDYKKHVIERRGNNYDRLCNELLKHLNVKDSEYITKKYNQISEDKVLIEKICSKKAFLAQRLAKRVLKEAEENEEETARL